MAKTAASSQSMSMGSYLNKLEMTLDVYFGKKAPQLPANIKEFIVKISPYLTIIGILLAAPALLVVFGLTAAFAPLMVLSQNWSVGAIIPLVALIVTLVLEVMAVPGLFKRQKSAWDKLFWVSLVSIISSLASASFFGLVVGTAISWYFLFQIRSYYK